MVEGSYDNTSDRLKSIEQIFEVVVSNVPLTSRTMNHPPCFEKTSPTRRAFYFGTQ
jgi:hypothetical protein